MNTEHSQAVFNLLLYPGRILTGGWEFFLSWLSTRVWAAYLLCVPPVACLSFMLISSFIGSTRDPEALLNSYWDEVAIELGERDSTESDSEEIPDEEQITEYVELLLQRIIQIDTSNTRATYLVARQLGARGRLGQAQMMMRRIAGAGSHGFPPAHAWLAQTRLAWGAASQEEKNLLMHDLEVASTWKGMNPMLSVVFADLLVADRRVNEAIGILERAAANEPKLWLKIASVATENNLVQPFETAAQAIRGRTDPKIATKTASVEDFVHLAHLEALENDYDTAIALIEQALRLDPTSEFAKRTLSEAYRKKFLQTADFDERKFQLELLDMALKADSSNPRVSEEVARLVAIGQRAPPELTELLEQKLAAGQATAITHILLSNRELLDGDFPAAIGHLEIAHQLAPASPIVLNNLAMATARNAPQDREVLERAERLLLQAIQIVRSPEFLDSLGEVQYMQDDFVRAVESYEAAIGLDGERPNTRRKLAAAYRAIGLKDMADIQEKIAADSDS